MQVSMKISIIGAGSTALAAASYLKVQGLPVTLYVRNEEKRKLWNTTPVNVSGVVDTSFFVPISKTLQEAMDGADLVLVMTRTGDYEAVIAELTPHLRKGQCLIFMNGCWGAVKAVRFLKKNREQPDVTIAETANMPFIAQLSDDWKSLNFKAVKSETAYASIGDDDRLSTFFHVLSPKVTRVSSPASTSLSATNPIIHVTGCLFNMSRIENGEDFLFFGNPLTKRMASYMEACDAERMAIGKALGAPLASLLDTLNSFWGSHYTTLHEALTSIESYKTVKGPKSPASRYLSEDLPCGLTALMDLADMIHVKAPHIAALVYTLDLYLGTKYKPFLTIEDLRTVKALK